MALSNKGTHRHSKSVSRPSGGYKSINGRMSGGSRKVGRPDVAYSTGKGRHSVANATVKNHA